MSPRKARKLLIIPLLFALYAIECAVIHLLFRGEWKQKKALAGRTLFYSHLVLKAAGVKVVVTSQRELPQGSLIVSNHLSYLDILIIASVLKCSFVTSEQMKHTAFLGQLARLAGALFVKRTEFFSLPREIQQIAACLCNGIDVVVFPESTSSNGEKLLRFRRALVEAATVTGAAVTPICLNYLSIDCQPVNKLNRDVLFWYGDMSIISHIWHLLDHRQLLVELKLLETIADTSAKDSISLTTNAFAQISEHFRPIT